MLFLVSFCFIELKFRHKITSKKLLNISDLKERALETLKNMDQELQRLELNSDIQSKVREDMDQQQREYYLHQQMRTIQEELGGASHDEEIEEMRVQAKI